MQPDLERFILLPDTQIYAVGLIIKFNFQLDPYEKDILFLFCGRRSDRIKGLVWEGWIPSPLQKAGDRLQTPDPGSASSGSPVKHCAKRRKSKIFSHSPSRAD